MAIAMTLEQGKPIAQSRLEILRGCDIIEWDATEGRRVYGRIIPSEPGMRHTVLRQPIGVVAAFPLALINPVGSLDEAIEKANGLPYGLAAYAFTRSARNADRLAEGVEAGNLSINHFVASIAETPFGGVKDSDYGREGGTEGLECYTVAKNVSHLVM
jgi:succinate-semialdehyde dehydrogenase/glutarate-semialdehyde dehydrogenase